MKKLTFLLCLLIALLPSLSQATEIEFEHSDWNSILAKAGKENKIVFLDAYTTWCGPCKWMAANTFTNEDVAEFFNQNFVNAKIDMEKGEGPELAKRYGVNAYPTLLFVSSNGDLVHLEIGAKDAANFLELGKEIIDPSFVSVATMAKRFKAGERDRKFLKDYLLRLSASSAEFNEVLEPFKEGMKGEGLLDENSWEVFKAYFSKPDSEYAQYFLSHRDAFEAKFGMEPVIEKAMGFYYNKTGIAIYNKDKAAFDAARAETAASGLPTADAMVYEMDINWYLSNKDFSNFIKSVNMLLGLSYDVSPISKNSYAWTVYENCDAKKQLKTALKWINSALETNEDETLSYFMLDTKAMLLLKLGKKKEGFEIGDEAIEAAKAIGEDYSETEKEMDKYR